MGSLHVTTMNIAVLQEEFQICWGFHLILQSKMITIKFALFHIGEGEKVEESTN